MKQTISKSNLNKLYKIACNDWKVTIADLVMNSSSDCIEVEESLIKKAYNAADDKQKQLISKFFKVEVYKSIIDRVKDFSDILRISGKKLSDIHPWKNPKNKAQESQNALAEIQLITEVYNEEELDWTNSNQRKYYPYFYKDKKTGWRFVGWLGDDGGGLAFGMYFDSSEKAIDAGKKFIDIYKRYLPE